jgi:hypothetical protein
MEAGKYLSAIFLPENNTHTSARNGNGAETLHVHWMRQDHQQDPSGDW